MMTRVGDGGNPGPRNQPEWARRDEFENHRTNAFAHGEMVGRIMQENATIRERFENRLSSLERFRAQATLLGGLGLLVLGAVTSTLAFRIFH